MPTVNDLDYAGAARSNRATPPPNPDSMICRLENISQILGETEQILQIVFDKWHGPAPMSQDKHEEPRGINGMTLEIQSRAMRIRDILRDFEAMLG